LRLADQCAQEAVRRDPGLPEAHLARGWVSLFRDWAWPEARETLERAIALGPVELNHWLALLLALGGDVERARAALNRARESDPLSAAALALGSFVHDISGDHERALAAARRAVELRPHHHLGHWRAGVALSRLGRHDEATAALRRAVDCSGGGTAVRCELAWALAAGGRAEEARALLAAIEADTAATYLSPYHRAKVLCALGDEPGALAQLELAAEDRDPWIVLLGVDAALEPLREAPRFRRLAVRMLRGEP
jgi:tetratricopeptide (TPR) repeat protein